MTRSIAEVRGSISFRMPDEKGLLASWRFLARSAQLPFLLLRQYSDKQNDVRRYSVEMQSNGDSTSDGSAAQHQRTRLPVNPRRAKVAPEQRKRVIRA